MTPAQSVQVLLCAGSVLGLMAMSIVLTLVAAGRHRPEGDRE